MNKLVICGGQKSKLKECLSMKFGNSDIFMDSFRLEKKLTMSNYTLLCFIVLRHKKKMSWYNCEFSISLPHLSPLWKSVGSFGHNSVAVIIIIILNWLPGSFFPQRERSINKPWERERRQKQHGNNGTNGAMMDVFITEKGSQPKTVLTHFPALPRYLVQKEPVFRFL